jgi:Ca2+-binding EF-hand superfamily protein
MLTFRVMLSIAIAAVGAPILIACGNPASSDSATGDAAGAQLTEDAAISAVLSDGDGEGLSTLVASDEPLFSAAEEAVASIMETTGGYARSCRLRAFEEAVIQEYDTNGDGRLDRRERRQLRRDFRGKPTRRHRFARHHKRHRVRWIYDSDDSRSLNESEREELRSDLEERCENRRIYLLDHYDEDGSGSLDEDEWERIHEDLDARREARREALLEEFDADEDGSLDLEERREAYRAFHEAMKQKRSEAIERFDLDGDGTLDGEEKAALRESLKQRMRGEHFGEYDE